MGSRNWVCAVVAMAALWDGEWVVAYHPPDCSAQIGRMQPCLVFVEGKTDTPASNCCKSLSWVYDNYPVCLCELISSSGGITSTPGINVTNAMLLPSYCNIPTDTSQCPALLTGSSSSSKPPPGSNSGNGSPASESLATTNLVSSLLFLSSLLALELVSTILIQGSS